jgi:hypothetical protein
MEELVKTNQLLGGLLVVLLLGTVAMWLIAMVTLGVFVAERGRRARTETTEDDWFRK